MNLLLISLIAASLFLISVRAEAGDSTCLLGNDGRIAVSTFEHRAGDGRATEVTLIYGSHILRGSLQDKDSGNITLSENGTKQLRSDDAGYKDNYVFKGTVVVDYENETITLEGKIRFTADDNDEPKVVRTKLECTELAPD